MSDAELAASFAIFAAKQVGADEVGPDHLLVGCFRAISRFGIATVGAWSFDLESLGVDWLRPPDGPRPKVAYSLETVALFDRAAQIAKSVGDRATGVNHLLAAFAAEEAGLMSKLKREHGITNASWRAAVARIGREESAPAMQPAASDLRNTMREYLTPEEAADVLGIHVQTMRSYIRTARVPAFRMAGERAIRIRRADLEKVLEPLESGTSKE